MAKTTKKIPDGFHVITPYLCVRNAQKALEFYSQAFGAKERCRMPGPEGKVGHAEMQIGDSIFMLADEFPDMDFKSPQSTNGTPVHLNLYVDDSDRMIHQAEQAGGQIIRPVKDQFYGDRSGTLRDPFGHIWHISTHMEDLTPEEIRKRMPAECK